MKKKTQSKIDFDDRRFTLATQFVAEDTLPRLVEKLEKVLVELRYPPPKNSWLFMANLPTFPLLQPQSMSARLLFMICASTHKIHVFGAASRLSLLLRLSRGGPEIWSQLFLHTTSFQTGFAILSGCNKCDCDILRACAAMNMPSQVTHSHPMRGTTKEHDMDDENRKLSHAPRNLDFGGLDDWETI